MKNERVNITGTRVVNWQYLKLNDVHTEIKICRWHIAFKVKKDIGITPKAELVVDERWYGKMTKNNWLDNCWVFNCDEISY